MPGLCCRHCGKFMVKDETDGVSWRCISGQCSDGVINLTRRGLTGYLRQRMADLAAEREEGSLEAKQCVDKIARELSVVGSFLWKEDAH